MAPNPKRHKTSIGSTNSRKEKEKKPEEISFDLSARQEFLTGFHKRKLQRAKFAKERAESRAREERIEERKKLREDRKTELERHVKAVNDLLRPADLQVDSDDERLNFDTEWNGLEDGGSSDAESGKEAKLEVVDHEAEYIDEDKYTTVTVEAMDVTKDGLFKAAQQDDGPASAGGAGEDEKEGQSKVDQVAQNSESHAVKRKWSKEKPSDGPRKPRKKRNFRYENKTERKFSRAKERLKNSRQAKARKSN